jgi:mono/diheme cytochrome c family protein
MGKGKSGERTPALGEGTHMTRQVRGGYRTGLRAWLLVVAACGAGFVAAVGRPLDAQAGSLDEHFKYGSVGIEESEGMPYWIWQVLPIMFKDKLPGPGGYSSFGILWEAGKELPIGFSKKRVTVDRVAINCALCHTTRVRISPTAQPMLIPGGPANVMDPQRYARFLHDAAGDPRFNAGDVLSEIGKLTSLSWSDSLLYRFAFIPGTKRALLRQREALAWMNDRPDPGPGRVDPFNPPKFSILEQPIDDTIGNSDMMSLWGVPARTGGAFHWDGLNGSLREVMVSSALGDGASRKSVDTASLARVEEWIRNVRPPAYPFPVDTKLAEAGQRLYEERCAACHSAGGARAGTVIPLDEVGTDRHRLDMWTAGAAEAYNNYGEGYSWRLSAFRKTNGYIALLHDGLWARAPYLHNGSVPTLADLLETPEKRPIAFYRGFDLYDPVKVGFVSAGPEAEQAGFKYDTNVPANGNQGHLWGTDLPAPSKTALLEYLKTR